MKYAVENCSDLSGHNNILSVEENCFCYGYFSTKRYCEYVARERTDATMGFVEPTSPKVWGGVEDVWLLINWTEKGSPITFKVHYIYPIIQRNRQVLKIWKEKNSLASECDLSFSIFCPYGANVIVNCRVWLFSFHISTVGKGCHI